MMNKHEGNADIFDVCNVLSLPFSVLENKNIAFLGSSITLGYGSENISFVDYMAKRHKFKYAKEAVSGTTLSCIENNSYVSRLEKMDTTVKYDLFVVQLSANDADKNMNLGSITSRDNKSICGAINYIIDYIKDNFKCPIIFYSACHYENKNYASMVLFMEQIAKVRDIGFINLYSDSKFNDINEDMRKLYMADGIHPTKAGYLLWWCQHIENQLIDYYLKKQK